MHSQDATLVRTEFDCEKGDVFVIEAPPMVVRVEVKDIDEEAGEILLELDLPPGCAVSVDNIERDAAGVPSCKGMPRVWVLFSFILSHRIRRDIFMPAFNEFLEDYVFSRKTFKTAGSRRWLWLAFSVRTLSMFWACLKMQFAGICEGVITWIWSLIRKIHRS